MCGTLFALGSFVLAPLRPSSSSLSFTFHNKITIMFAHPQSHSHTHLTSCSKPTNCKSTDRMSNHRARATKFNYLHIHSVYIHLTPLRVFNLAQRLLIFTILIKIKRSIIKLTSSNIICEDILLCQIDHFCEINVCGNWFIILSV